jgi:chemotaxis protein CheX
MEKYIQPFIDVCKTVFKDFVGVELRAGRTYFVDTTAETEWDLSGVIGLSGEARGAVVITMKKNLALKITDILTSGHHTNVDEEVVDAVGEIVNIIAGNVKKNLEEAFRLVISLPTIIQGKGHQIKWPIAQTRIISIPFEAFENDLFYLSVAIESVKGRL